MEITVKILKIGTPEIITIIVLQLEQLDFTVQYCVQKMPTAQCVNEVYHEPEAADA